MMNRHRSAIRPRFRSRTAGLSALLLGIAASLGLAEDAPTSKNSGTLRDALQRWPQADTNKDGLLTEAEANAAMKKLGIVRPAREGEGVVAPPTLSNVKYGPERRQVLDFWKADSKSPAPLVIFIHGGGFKQGDKTDVSKRRNIAALMETLHNQGMACASINYRFIDTTPLDQILRDGARAVQFLRTKSSDWNIDKNRIGAVGGSAGAGMSLWLATRDDLADPQNPDPVLRESSRVGPIILLETQATYNFPRWESFLGKPGFVPEPNESATMFRLRSDKELETPRGQALLRECDMLEWMGKGDKGPILSLITRKTGTNKNWDGYVHNPLHAEEIGKTAAKAGIPFERLSDRSVETYLFFLKNFKQG